MDFNNAKFLKSETFIIILYGIVSNSSLQSPENIIISYQPKLENESSWWMFLDKIADKKANTLNSLKLFFN